LHIKSVNISNNDLIIKVLIVDEDDDNHNYYDFKDEELIKKKNIKEIVFNGFFPILYNNGVIPPC
jgi:hypothetical protein